MGCFDGHYIVTSLIDSKIEFKVLMRGSKYLTLTIPAINVRFIDSYNFLKYPLRDLPDVFGISNLRKQFFPYSFLKPETLNYVGPIPELKYFQTGEYDQEMETWYEQNKHKTFYCKNTLIEYCLRDVDLLTQIMLTFRKYFYKITQDDIFHNITLAQAGFVHFRNKCLKPKSILLLSDNLSSNIRVNHSKFSMSVLLFIEQFKRIKLRRFGAPGGEWRIGRYFVDGFHIANVDSTPHNINS